MSPINQGLEFALLTLPCTSAGACPSASSDQVPGRVNSLFKPGGLGRQNTCVPHVTGYQRGGPRASKGQRAGSSNGDMNVSLSERERGGTMFLVVPEQSGEN